ARRGCERPPARAADRTVRGPTPGPLPLRPPADRGRGDRRVYHDQLKPVIISGECCGSLAGTAVISGLTERNPSGARPELRARSGLWGSALPAPRWLPRAAQGLEVMVAHEPSDAWPSLQQPCRAPPTGAGEAPAAAVPDDLHALRAVVEGTAAGIGREF